MNSTRKILASLAVIAFVAVAIFGGLQLSSDSTTPISTPQASGSLPTVTGGWGQTPQITIPSATPPAELTKSDLIVGTGAEVLPTSTLTVHYILKAWSDGAVIDSSWGADPATFPLAQVVEGWQKGLPGAKVGGRRLLVLPPSMGYGAAGAGPVKPNETLVFVVDIIGVS